MFACLCVLAHEFSMAHISNQVMLFDSSQYLFLPAVNSTWWCWRAGVCQFASLALLVLDLWPLHTMDL